VSLNGVGFVVVYGLVKGEVRLSRIARCLNVSANTVWKWVRFLMGEGVVVKKNSKYVVKPTVDSLRIAVSYLLRKCPSIENMLSTLAEIEDRGWVASGSYALYYYDTYYVLPPKPSHLTLAFRV